jgi:RNA polymerase sigma factor (TIGR02999 family)
MDASQDVTGLLQRASDGDPVAFDAVFPVVYEQLRGMAHRQLRLENVGHTLGTTALVHEAYLRLVDQRQSRFKDRAHFFAIAATAMRRILVDHARRHGALKRGAGARRVPLESVDLLTTDDRADLLVSLDAALVRLAGLDSRQAKVVEYRFFGGLTEDETAEALGVSARTVKRDWAKARSWLYADLYPEQLD